MWEPGTGTGCRKSTLGYVKRRIGVVDWRLQFGSYGEREGAPRFYLANASSEPRQCETHAVAYAVQLSGHIRAGSGSAQGSLPIEVVAASVAMR